MFACERFIFAKLGTVAISEMLVSSVYKTTIPPLGMVAPDSGACLMTVAPLPITLHFNALLAICVSATVTCLFSTLGVVLFRFAISSLVYYRFNAHIRQDIR